MIGRPVSMATPLRVAAYKVSGEKTSQWHHCSDTQPTSRPIGVHHTLFVLADSSGLNKVFNISRNCRGSWNYWKHEEQKKRSFLGTDAVSAASLASLQLALLQLAALQLAVLTRIELRKKVKLEQHGRSVLTDGEVSLRLDQRQHLFRERQ